MIAEKYIFIPRCSRETVQVYTWCMAPRQHWGALDCAVVQVEQVPCLCAVSSAWWTQASSGLPQMLVEYSVMKGPPTF